jgi:two-component system nitrogen regulation sensor histidine kinase NtrY
MSKKKNRQKIQIMLGKFRRWAQKVALVRKLGIAFIIAALLSGIATYSVFTLPEGPKANLVSYMFALDFFLLLCLVLLFVQALVKAYREKRKGSEGSALMLRAIILFLMTTAMPAVLITLFSLIFFSIVVQAWFGTQVYNAVKESKNVAEAYFEDYSKSITYDAMLVVNDIDMLRMDRNRLEDLLTNRLLSRGVDEAVIFDASGKIMAKSGYTFVLSSEQVPFSALEEADDGKISLTVSRGGDWIRALVRIPNSIFYLYIGKMVDSKVIGHIDRARDAVNKYEMLEQERSTIEITFVAIFIVVALLLMLISAWVGMQFASRISKPIIRLIDAADKVKNGDLTVRVAEENKKDEISILTRTFNRMLGRIANTNKQLEERRIFTETVLSGVSSGVVGTDEKGTIRVLNKAVEQFAGVDFKIVKGKNITLFVPETKEMMEQVNKNRNKIISTEIKTYKDGMQKVLLLRVAAENSSAKNDKVTGFVFTFDDITKLQTAERKAAWADVARRVAHEIKNPLTPIQLSAERLKRKYESQITEDRDNFKVCTDIIIQQVAEIGRMVDEFSAFARMPAPVIKETNLSEIVKQCIFMQKVANPSVNFKIVEKNTNVVINCDAEQVSRIVVNVLKNAAESIYESKNSEKGEVKVTVGQDGIKTVVSVKDNGKGLPDEEMYGKITEPYVTTKKDGTGLGLAIAKKIMDDHNGTIAFKNNNDEGAEVILTFLREEVK